MSGISEGGVVAKVVEIGKALGSGGLASAFSKTVFAPLERIKLVMQTQSLVNGHQAQYRGPVDALIRIPREQGVLSLWRGNTPNVLRIVPTYALRFTLFSEFQKVAAWGHGDKPLNLGRQMLAGALSGFTTVLVTHPLDLIRTRFSADLSKWDGRPDLAAKAPARTMWQAFRVLVRQEGIVGIYRGLPVSAVEITPYVAISLGGYNYLVSQIPSERTNSSSKFLVGWLSGLAASLVCYPLDTLKRRRMLDGTSGFMASGLPQKRAGVIPYFLGVLRREGVGVFYRGCLINALKSAPAASLTFVCNDLLRDLRV